MSKHLPFLVPISLLLLIIYDAAQQHYYLTTFDLIPEETSISFWDLLKNHLIRWCIWLSASSPYFLYVKRHYVKNESQVFNFRMTLFLLTSLTISLVSITLFGILIQRIPFNETNFVESFSFFFYQKGLTFLMSSLGVTLLVANHAKKKSLEVQLLEIKELRKINQELTENGDKEVPHLNIKTGYQLKPIPIDEIIWIQADDYCVKVHTRDNSYTLRKSLKDLERKLANFRFIRIHRSALLNLDYLDQINYRSSTVRLTDRSEVQASRTGIKKLKSKLVNS